jgi:hypothetical protein
MAPIRWLADLLAEEDIQPIDLDDQRELARLRADPAAIERLVEEFEGMDPMEIEYDERQELLMEIGSPVVPILVERFPNFEAYHREDTTHILAEIDDPSVHELLWEYYVETMQHGSSEEQVGAMYNLVDIRDSRVTPELLRRVQNYPEGNFFELWAFIAKAADGRIVRPLAELLLSDRIAGDDRVYAYNALCEVLYRVSLHHLGDWLGSDDPRISYFVAATLRRLSVTYSYYL